MSNFNAAERIAISNLAESIRINAWSTEEEIRADIEKLLDTDTEVRVIDHAGPGEDFRAHDETVTFTRAIIDAAFEDAYAQYA